MATFEKRSLSHKVPSLGNSGKVGFYEYNSLITFNDFCPNTGDANLECAVPSGKDRKEVLNETDGV